MHMTSRERAVHSTQYVGEEQSQAEAERLHGHHEDVERLLVLHARRDMREAALILLVPLHGRIHLLLVELVICHLHNVMGCRGRLFRKLQGHFCRVPSTQLPQQQHTWYARQSQPP